MEIEATAETARRCVEAAKAEVAFIQKVMAKLEPLRKYGHLPLEQAHQAAQHEEWKLELIYRAENFLITAGTIPSDHFATMRQHPAFKDEIYPHLESIQNLIRQKNVPEILKLTQTRRLDIPALLGYSPDQPLLLTGQP